MTFKTYTYPEARDEYENLLFAYAAGQLNETLSLMVATHLHFCKQARALVESMEHVGGALLEANCPQTNISASCFDALMSKIEAFEANCPASAVKPSTKCQKTKEALACLNDYDDVDDLIAFLMRKLPKSHENCEEAGLHIFEIGCEKNEPDSHTNYVHVDTQSCTKLHTHQGLEITLVLDGEIEDNGVTYRRGALLVADERVEHSPRNTGKGRCTCLVFSEHPTRLISLLISFLGCFL